MQNRQEGKIKMDFEVERLEPLFASEAEYNAFKERHDKHQVPVKDLSTYHGKVFLGIDAGSTTTKAALVGEDGTLLYSFYHNNDGDPLGTTIHAIKDIYRQLPEGVEIVHSCSTGYGEALIKAALLLDKNLDLKKDFESEMIGVMQKQMIDIMAKLKNAQTALEASAEGMRNSILGGDKAKKDSASIAVVDEYLKKNSYKLVDPLSLADKLQSLKEEREDLYKELDTAVKISNATTTIQVNF